jgi:hypothetical protein
MQSAPLCILLALLLLTLFLLLLLLLLLLVPSAARHGVAWMIVLAQGLRLRPHPHV